MNCGTKLCVCPNPNPNPTVHSTASSSSPSNVNKIKLIPIAPNILLKDIATIKWSNQINNTAYIGNGEQAIAISVQRAPGGKVLATSDSAREIMAKSKKSIQI